MKKAIVLFNLGGPDKEESIRPFLFNLFNDKYIISLPQPFRFLLAKFISKKREKTAKEIYSNLGMKSPILEITQNQADELEKELSFKGDYKVFVAMRYWHPFSYETAKKIRDYQPDQIILLPLYPQFSTATSQSSIEDFVKALENEGLKTNYNDENNKNLIDLRTVCCYFDDDDFIYSHAKLLYQKVLDSGLDLDEFRILFSAHGLPQKIIDSGDPYVFQVEVSAKKIIEKLEDFLRLQKTLKKGDKIDNRVCYQSKVGPLKWTSPSLEQEMRRAAVDEKAIIIAPIAFVSEHSETLVELDIEYKELAEKLKIKKYIRVQALNINGYFIKSLAKICDEVSKNENSGFFSSSKPKRSCSQDFKRCMNNRKCEKNG